VKFYRSLRSLDANFRQGLVLTHDGQILPIIMYLYGLEEQIKGLDQRSKTYQMPNSKISCKSHHMSSCSITPAGDIM
jgi:hypothetical protein